MSDNPGVHQRKSIRLKGYNYAKQGSYFVTICTQNREHVFGKINNGIMRLNPCGNMINSWIFEIENKFVGIKITSYIIMPNHIHAIITNTPPTIEPTDAPVGADLRVCPPVRSRKNKIQPNAISLCNADTHQGEHVGSPLHRVVQWFKTMTTNEYIRCVKSMGWKPFDRKLWQRNYYEHIIRNEHSLNHIKIYIENNPKKWEEDKLYYPNQNGDMS